MRVHLAAAMLCAAVIAVPLHSQAITPTGTFGPLVGATFGGTGIPNHAVMQSTVGGVTLGLTATQRYVGPNLGNDGAGTFYAPTGTSAPGLSKWNFSFYVGGGPVSIFNYILRYDFDPGVGNAAATHGTIFVPGGAVPGGFQDSQNLGFAYLDTGAPGVTPPAYASFNPNAEGSYTFSLEQYSGTDLVNEVAIDVIVGTPEPTTITLMATGLLGLGMAARRRRKA